MENKYDVCVAVELIHSSENPFAPSDFEHNFVIYESPDVRKPFLVFAGLSA